MTAMTSTISTVATAAGSRACCRTSQQRRPHDPGDVVRSSAEAITNQFQTQKTNHLKTPELKPSPLATKTSRALSDLSEKGVKEISASLQELFADVFALYVKNQEFSLAHDRSELPRLPPPAG